MCERTAAAQQKLPAAVSGAPSLTVGGMPKGSEFVCARTTTRTEEQVISRWALRVRAMARWLFGGCCLVDHSAGRVLLCSTRTVTSSL